MRLLQIARKDVRDSVRSRYLYVMTGLFGLLGALLGSLGSRTTGTYLLFLFVFGAPLASAVFTQSNIAGKRESNEMTVLLGLPFSRWDIFAGSYLGRSVVVIATVVSTYLAATVLTVLLGNQLFVRGVGLSVLYSLLVSLMFVSIFLGISASTASTNIAASGSFLSFFLFVLWTRLPTAVLFLINGFRTPRTRPVWAKVFPELSPFTGISNLFRPLAEQTELLIPFVQRELSAPLPAYKTPLAGTLVVLFWLVVPALLGYLRFERTDL